MRCPCVLHVFVRAEKIIRSTMPKYFRLDSFRKQSQKKIAPRAKHKRRHSVVFVSSRKRDEWTQSKSRESMHIICTEADIKGVEPWQWEPLLLSSRASGIANLLNRRLGSPRNQSSKRSLYFRKPISQDACWNEIAF